LATAPGQRANGCRRVRSPRFGGPLQKHVPGYIRDYDAIRAKGVDLIVCVSINDPFVMQAWGKALNADGKVLRPRLNWNATNAGAWLTSLRLAGHPVHPWHPT